MHVTDGQTDFLLANATLDCIVLPEETWYIVFKNWISLHLQITPVIWINIYNFWYVNGLTAVLLSYRSAA